MWQAYEVRNPDRPQWDFGRVNGSMNVWPYEKYMKAHWLSLTKNGFIREYYDLPLPAMVDTIRREVGFLAHTIPAIEVMQGCGVNSLLSLIDAVATRSSVERFVTQVGFSPDALMALLHDFRRFIPEPVAMPKLIPDEDEAGQAAYAVLKTHKITTSYPMLERGRKPIGRELLSAETGLPLDTILDFAHRADMSRMWMAGGMVRRFVMVGVRCLRDLQSADPHDLRLKLEAYYRSIGMGVSIESTDKNAIGLVEAARKMAIIVEE